jgi:hypothetical protein
LLATSAPAASFATDSIASLASDDDQPFEEPAMLNRFLPLAALIYVSVSLPAHAQAQEIDYELGGEDYEAVHDNNGQLISVELDSW